MPEFVQMMVSWCAEASVKGTIHPEPPLPPEP